MTQSNTIIFNNTSFIKCLSFRCCCQYIFQCLYKHKNTVCVLESHLRKNSLWMISRYYECCCVKSGAMLFLTALMMSGWPRSVMTIWVMQHQGLFGLCLTSDLFENPDYPRSILVTQLLHWPLNKANTLLTWWIERAFEKSLIKSHVGFFSHFNII